MTHDREVMVASVKAVLREQMVEHRLNLHRWNKRGFAAHLANEVLVVVLHGEMPPSRLVSQVDMMDQTDPGEIIECPVRSGRIDWDTVSFDAPEDVLGGEKTFVVAGEYGANRTTRHREAQTRITDLLVNGVLEIGIGLTHHFATIAIMTTAATDLCCNCLQQAPVAL